MSKRLGQHFLVNKAKLRKIAEELDLKPDDVVIEIGAGHGELTNEVIRQLSNLVIKRYKIIAVEKDENLAKKLKHSIEIDTPENSIEIIHGDILKILPRLITQLPNYPIVDYKITGNIPYYITGYLLRIIGELDYKPSLIVLTLQKEVAERICAEPPKMNLLAASAQLWAEPKIVGYISKKDFRPQPKVDSAIIKLVIKQLSNYEITQLPSYYRFIKVLFKQPRKTILNNLVAGIGPQISKGELIKKIEILGINPNDRPQNLNIEQIIELLKNF